MEIYLTGATGLLGSHLLTSLLANPQNHIKALKRKHSDLSLLKRVAARQLADFETHLKRVDWIEGDVLQPDVLLSSMQHIDQVYHCAAVVSFDPSDKEAMMLTNVEGTANMVQSALACKVKQFCYVSSVAALGRAEENRIFDENIAWEPSKNNSLYSISKHAAENKVWEAAAAGLKVVVVNPSLILGAGNWNTGSAELFNTIAHGLPFYTFGVNGFVDVRDVVRAMISLMQNEKFGQRYVLSAENVSYQKLFNLIAENVGIKKPFIPAGKMTGELAWRFFKVLGKIKHHKPIITEETARTANAKHYYSSAKIENELSFRFTSIEETIGYMASVFLKEND